MRRAVVAFLCGLVFAGPAAQADPFPFGFVTEDPFAAPGEAPKRNDLTLLGGIYANETFGGAAEFYSATYLDSYMLGAVAGHDFYNLGAGFVLGGIVGGALRFGDDDPETTAELWTGLRLKHHGLLVGNLLISPALTAGFSVVTGPNSIERINELNYDGDATFLGFIGPEVALRWRNLPNVEMVTQLHHRSGGDGTLGDMGEGSNALTLGARFKF
jgi:hypothetical protein